MYLFSIVTVVGSVYVLTKWCLCPNRNRDRTVHQIEINDSVDSDSEKDIRYNESGSDSDSDIVNFPGDLYQTGIRRRRVSPKQESPVKDFSPKDRSLEWAGSPGYDSQGCMENSDGIVIENENRRNAITKIPSIEFIDQIPSQESTDIVKDPAHSAPLVLHPDTSLTPHVEETPNVSNDTVMDSIELDTNHVDLETCLMNSMSQSVISNNSNTLSSSDMFENIANNIEQQRMRTSQDMEYFGESGVLSAGVLESKSQ